MNNLDKIRYALNSLYVSGRDSLENLLFAMRNLKETDISDKSDHYTRIKEALCRVTVHGEKDVNTLLACIELLDELIEKS